jgi:RNA polymerase sigma-70 factor, ECF subfamily
MQTGCSHLTDEALLELVARSDDAALAELYDRYSRQAYGLALRIIRDEALAQDAVQEAFLAVWRTADRYLGERARASTWLLTIVHRRSVDVVRREERRRGEVLEDRHGPSGDATDAKVDLRERRIAVQRVLKKLPDDQRQALELAYYGGLTQSELAERLGVPIGTIKSRMFAGLSRLRDLLAEAGLEETVRP